MQLNSPSSKQSVGDNHEVSKDKSNSGVNHKLKSIIEISGSMLSNSPKINIGGNSNSDHTPPFKTPVNEPAVILDINNFTKSQGVLSSKNDKIVTKNASNIEKYIDKNFKYKSYSNLKAKLKHITNKKSSPYTKIAPFDYNKTKGKYAKQHTKSKKSDSHQFNTVK